MFKKRKAAQEIQRPEQALAGQELDQAELEVEKYRRLQRLIEIAKVSNSQLQTSQRDEDARWAGRR